MNDEEDVIVEEEGIPEDPGDESVDEPVDEEPVPPVEDEGERPDVDWDEDPIEGESNAQQVFDSQPVPPYRPGDVWNDSGAQYVCINGKAAGEQFAEGDWVPAEVPVVPPPTVTKQVKIREAILDFSAESIAAYQARGAVPFAVYDDGTSVQVEWSDVHEIVTPDVPISEAMAALEATNQHFWHRATAPEGDTAGTGAFVTDEAQEDFLAAIAAGTEPTEARPLHNLLMNAEGILLRAAKRIRAAFLPSGVAFYDGEGNAASNIVARFGSDGAQVGKDGARRLNLTSSMLSYTDNNYQANAPMFGILTESGSVASRMRMTFKRCADFFFDNTSNERVTEFNILIRPEVEEDRGMAGGRPYPVLELGTSRIAYGSDWGELDGDTGETVAGSNVGTTLEIGCGGAGYLSLDTTFYKKVDDTSVGGASATRLRAGGSSGNDHLAWYGEDIVLHEGYFDPSQYNPLDIGSTPFVQTGTHKLSEKADKGNGGTFTIDTPATGYALAFTADGTFDYLIGHSEDVAQGLVYASPASAAGTPTFRALEASDIPALPASKIATGTLAAARIPSLDASKIGSGTFAAARIPTLDIGTKTSGTLAINRGGTGETTADAAWTALGGGAIGKKDSLAASDIPNLNTSKLTAGTLGVARGGTGASTLASGSYLVGNGTNAVSLKTPAQVLSDIGAAAASDLDDYLPLSGGTLTGALNGTTAQFSSWVQAAGTLGFGNGAAGTQYVLSAKTPNRNGRILFVGGGKKADGDSAGTVVGLGAGGLTIVGGGEYATNRYNVADLNDTAEQLYLGSDNDVYIETNGNTIANRKTFRFAAGGFFLMPAGGTIEADKRIDLGDRSVSGIDYHARLETSQTGTLHLIASNGGYSSSNTARGDFALISDGRLGVRKHDGTDWVSGYAYYDFTSAATLRSSIGAEQAGTCLPLSGGTMTGSIRLSSGYSLFAKNTTHDVAASSLSAQTDQNGAVCLDKNDLVTASFLARQLPTGEVRGILQARHNNASGTAVWNGLQLGVKPDGTRTVTLSDASAWRSALGLGEVKNANFSTAKSVASATTTSLGTITLAAGTWLILGHVHFVANANGVREASINTSVAIGASGSRLSAMSMNATGNAQGFTVQTVETLTASTTYNLNVYQNSGSALNTTGYIRAVRLA